MNQPLLELRNVDTFYGPIHILQKVNLHVNKGRVRCAARWERVWKINNTQDRARFGYS